MDWYSRFNPHSQAFNLRLRPGRLFPLRFQQSSKTDLQSGPPRSKIDRKLSFSFPSFFQWTRLTQQAFPDCSHSKPLRSMNMDHIIWSFHIAIIDVDQKAKLGTSWRGVEKYHCISWIEPSASFKMVNWLIWRSDKVIGNYCFRFLLSSSLLGLVPNF